jgi:hypothetical protein
MMRWVALAVVLSACGPSAERLEADQVRAAIDRLRAAPAADVAGRKALVESLEKKPAVLAEAKRARDACAAAYRLMVESRELAARAREEIAAPGKGAEGLGDLDASEKKLAAATAAMPACDEASTALKVALSH